MSDSPAQPDPDLFWKRAGFKDRDGRVIDDEQQQVMFEGIDLYLGPAPKRRSRRELQSMPLLWAAG